MKHEDISKAIGGISAHHIEEAAPLEESTALPRIKHRLPVALVAVIVVLLLSGYAVVATIYGDSIQNWFAHQWKAITGQSMSVEHIAVIEHLSQEIGVSQTVGDITITVDSATVGDDNFFLLLRVEGMAFSEQHSYDFERATLETNPNPLNDGAFVGYGIDYLGVDGNGSALLLVDYEYLSYSGYTQDTRPLQVWLSLQNLLRDAHTDKQENLAEGEWYYSFVIDRSQTPESISLPDTKVMAVVLDTAEEVPVTITSIELTNTGLRFQFEHEQGALSLSDNLIEVVLKNGKTIGNDGGIASPTEGNVDMMFTYQWLIPVNLEEVAFVRFGSTEIPVSCLP